jgi:large subunit ribosomal protein L30
MAAQAAKLHAVTLVRSPIGKSATVKKTLEALGLTRMHKTTIHKNTPAVNGMLRTVIECIDVQVLFVPSQLCLSVQMVHKLFQRPITWCAVSLEAIRTALLLHHTLTSLLAQPVKFEEKPTTATPRAGLFFDHTNTLRGVSEAAFKAQAGPETTA